MNIFESIFAIIGEAFNLEGLLENIIKVLQKIFDWISGTGIAFLLCIALVLSGCLVSPGFSTTTTTTQYDIEGHVTSVTVEKIKITPSWSIIVVAKFFGGQCRVQYKLNPDDTWEITLDKAADDLDSTAQGEVIVKSCDVVIKALESYLSGGASIKGLFGSAEVSADTVKVLLEGLKGLREKAASGAITAETSGS